MEITPSLAIADDEITITFVRASGPGGQNVNKVSTAAQLRWDPLNSPSLPEDVKQRLIKLVGSRITGDGVLLIEAHRYRTQEQNRADALARLQALVEKALLRPKARRVTRPSAAVRARRLKTKKYRGEIKRLRGKPADEG